MEFVGQLSPSGACNLLGVPGLSSLDVDDDECEVVIGIRPKSSPLPRRRSSASDEDSEPGPPLSSSRRVSFADAKGLSLVQVKEFDTWDVPKLPEGDSSEGNGKDMEQYFLSPLTFSLPLSTEELLVKVQEQKVELESVELLPGTTILKGVIRVLNISFNKAVYVRTTLDTWSSHFDLLAEYVPGPRDSLMDRFSFKLTLVPPFGEQGARVDFCLRYETPVGTFWANNDNRNYVLFCHQRAKERKETPQKETVNKKSCLKTVSQIFSTVENISATETSSQGNISTDVSERGEEPDTVKAQHISDAQAGTPQEDGQKLLVESRRSCSRRRHRKAARMARVRDYFSLRNGGAEDAERDESPPEAKPAAQAETVKEKRSDVRSCPERSSKSQGSHFVSESLETCSETLASPAHGHTSNSDAESIMLADSATLTGAESDTDIPDSSSNGEPAPAEGQNISESVSKAEESSTEPADSSGLVSHSSSFTFGTVVAPLYHQVFGTVGSGSDWGNPVRASLHAGDLTQSYPHSDRRQTSCSGPTEPGGNSDEVQGNEIETQESNHLAAAPNSPRMDEEEETSLILGHTEPLQDDPDQRCTDTWELSRTIPGDAAVRPHTVNILNADLLNPQQNTESVLLHGEAQEDNLTSDLQLPEDTHTHTETNPGESLTQSEAQEETSFMSLQASQSASERVSDETDRQASGAGASGAGASGARANGYKCESSKDDDIDKTATISTIDGISEEDEPLEAFHDLNTKLNNSATKETESSSDSCFETVDVTTPHISLRNVEAENTAENNSHEDEHSAETKVAGEVARNHIRGHEIEDEDTQKIEHHAVSKQEHFCFKDAGEINWEMMVEEEEKNILADEEESEAVSLKTVQTDQGRLEDAASESRDTTEMVWEDAAAREEENKDADVSEGELEVGEEDSAPGKVREEVEELVRATKRAGEEELVEEFKVEKREEVEETEVKEETHFAEIPEVSVERSDVQDEEETEVEEEMEVDLNDDAAGVEPGESTEVNLDENSDYEEGADEAGESDGVTVEDRENGAGWVEERLDITQNKVADSLFAPVNNVQRVLDRERGHIPTEMGLYKEEDFPSNKSVTPDLSNAAGEESDDESAAAERASYVFTDEPESEQTCNDSASADSDSDDEVELYMHCLRAVHTGTQAQKDRNKDAGFSASKRLSVSRGKLLSSPMPSISESLDEEQHLSRLQDGHEDTEAAAVRPAAAALPSGQESISTSVSWWKETFSLSNISKTLLYFTLLVFFVVVAYRYDFLACFGLYLISVVWLYCQGEKQPEQHKQPHNRLN